MIHANIHFYLHQLQQTTKRVLEKTQVRKEQQQKNVHICLIQDGTWQVFF